jgi:hypothetical protein
VNAAPAGFPPARGEEWRSLFVAHIDGRTFDGWWRESHNLVWAVVADPPPRRIVALPGARDQLLQLQLTR